jgi:dTMP kinase
MNGTLPKITFVFMVSAEIGLERIKATRGEKTDRMDNEALSMLQKVYDGYRTLLDEDKTGRLVEIDASKNIEEVFEQVYEKITPFV